MHGYTPMQARTRHRDSKGGTSGVRLISPMATRYYIIVDARIKCVG
eukprot:COSAG05_NODE_24796_length_209_cov_790.427273_1_plen_45_part_01